MFPNRLLINAVHTQTWNTELPFFFLIDILYKSLIPDKLAALHKPQAESCQVLRTLILIQKNSYAHAQLQVYGSLRDLWAWDSHPSSKERYKEHALLQKDSGRIDTG